MLDRLFQLIANDMLQESQHGFQAAWATTVMIFHESVGICWGGKLVKTSEIKNGEAGTHFCSYPICFLLSNGALHDSQGL